MPRKPGPIKVKRPVRQLRKRKADSEVPQADDEDESIATFVVKKVKSLRSPALKLNYPVRKTNAITCTCLLLVMQYFIMIMLS